jgi:hypothetical protein
MSLVFFSTLVCLVIFVLTAVSEGHRTIVVAFLLSADMVYVVLDQRNSLLFY